MDQLRRKKTMRIGRRTLSSMKMMRIYRTLKFQGNLVTVSCVSANIST